jgi:branched-chain amino acid transport system permease protein
VTLFLQAVMSGLALGTIYALLALGFVIIYRATDVVSFAQPALMVFGAYWTVYVATVIGWNFWVALVIAAVLGAIMGSVVERLFLRPLVGRPVFSAVMVTIGLDIVLRVIVDDLLGVNQRTVGDPFGLQTVSVGGVTIPQSDIAAMLGAILVIAALLAFYRYTKYGLAMRAAAFDQEAAMAQGIPVGRMFNLAWALAGSMAAIAGTFISMGNSSLSRSTWVFALRALPVIVLGGLDSIRGAIVGGLMIGVAERLVAAYQPGAAPWLGAGFELVVPYIVMVVVLLVKPYGLYGTEEVQRV